GSAPRPLRWNPPRKSAKTRRLLMDAGLSQVESHVHDHIFLASDHPPSAQFHEDFAGIHAVSLRRGLRVPKKAGIHSGKPQRQRFAVDAHWTVLDGPDQFLRSIHEREEVAPVFDSHALEDGDQDFERRISRSRTHTGERSVYTCGAVLDGDNGICHTKREVVM